MDRDRFETGLDRLISAHDRKVCAEIDAGDYRTSLDHDRAHYARDAYAEAREAFLAEVFAPPPGAPPTVTLVFGRQERDRGRTRGRPFIWRRWIEIRIGWSGATYTFTADAESLTLDTGAVESGDDADLRSPEFDPLCAGHAVRFRGVDYATTDPGPAVLVKLAIEVCRAVALRLHAHGLDHFAARRAWPEHLPGFEELVGSVPQASAA